MEQNKIDEIDKLKAEVSNIQKRTANLKKANLDTEMIRGQLKAINLVEMDFRYIIQDLNNYFEQLHHLRQRIDPENKIYKTRYKQLFYTIPPTVFQIGKEIFVVYDEESLDHTKEDIDKGVKKFLAEMEEDNLEWDAEEVITQIFAGKGRYEQIEYFHYEETEQLIDTPLVNVIYFKPSKYY